MQPRLCPPLILLLLCSAGGTHKVQLGKKLAWRPNANVQLVVGMQPGHDVDSLLLGTGLTELESTADMHLIAVPAGTTKNGALALADGLAANASTLFAELNVGTIVPEGKSSCTAPIAGVGSQDCTVAIFDSDPSLVKFFGQETPLLIGTDVAHQMISATPTVVAVIDTGIDPTHPVLANNLFSLGEDLLAGGPAIEIADGKDNDKDGAVDEAFGHGTHVAGSIVLVHPQARILPLRVLDSDGNGKAYHVAKAILRAVELGADVINLSLAMSGPSAAVEAALEVAEDADIDILASAGNTGTSKVLFPAAYDSVTAVAALDADDVKAPFSAFGLGVDLSAPGVDIYSAYPGGGFAWWSGSSMATGIASGSVSLVRSLQVDLQFAELEAAEELEESSLSVDGINPGFEGLLGEGRVDLANAIQEILFED